MGESFNDRHDRSRGARNIQLERVGQSLRDLRTADEQVSVIPVEETAETEAVPNPEAKARTLEAIEELLAQDAADHPEI
jgi:hypothetical protein